MTALCEMAFYQVHLQQPIHRMQHQLHGICEKALQQLTKPWLKVKDSLQVNSIHNEYTMSFFNRFERFSPRKPSRLIIKG